MEVDRIMDLDSLSPVVNRSFIRPPYQVQPVNGRPNSPFINCPRWSTGLETSNPQPESDAGRVDDALRTAINKRTKTAGWQGRRSCSGQERIAGRSIKVTPMKITSGNS
jgi:hypothetical protein